MYKGLLVPNLILIVLLLLLQYYECVAANNVNISEIKINGKSLPVELFNDIVISDCDTINFKYALGFESKSPFLYTINLKHNDDVSERTIGTNEVSYSNLCEGEYEFSVNAFDLQGKWKTSIKSVTIRVNNYDANLLKKIKEKELELELADSLVVELKSSLEKDKEDVGFLQFFFYAFIYCVPVLLIILVVFLVLYRRIKKEILKLKSLSVSPIDKTEGESTDKVIISELQNKIDVINNQIASVISLSADITTNNGLFNNISSEMDLLHNKKSVVLQDIVDGVTNPVDSIKSLVELLRSYDFNSLELKEITYNIVESSCKIIDFVDEIRQYGELFSDSIPLQLEKIDIVKLIQTVVNNNLSKATHKNIKIKVHISPDIKHLVIDNNKIIYVFNQLINNAIEYSHNDSSVSIDGYVKDEQAVFKIVDTGVGITEEMLSKIQNSIFNSNDYSNKMVASHIGMLTVKKYIEMHKGNLIISSKSNEETKFVFNIPIS